VRSNRKQKPEQQQGDENTALKKQDVTDWRCPEDSYLHANNINAHGLRWIRRKTEIKRSENTTHYDGQYHFEFPSLEFDICFEFRA
jgi:hypothetical protein